jgi:hypothetical protein
LGVKGTQRETRQKRQIKKRRGRREDEFIPLKARAITPPFSRK